ncbi:unnamed protein product [Darwinula stevensoni]|uniref:Uncharacterized protein n=1 Tax=Darwinula stevensoni TaxID=69355 RepID=A0A7R9A4X9_9CRUS|nr:unnamed protein product [Darwinula stevensoni]CAG0893425.1 unnamed protein product [Darwinula stevensoni]
MTFVTVTPFAFLLPTLVSSLAQSDCGGTLTARRGNFSSPNFPILYPTDVSCYWEIKAPEGYGIHLSFDAFDLERSTGCLSDFVLVEAGNFTDCICGSIVPDSIFVPFNSMKVTFGSDDSGEGSGFFSSYEAERLIQGCEDEWLEHDGNCYWFSDDQLTPMGAEESCIERGGHLVSFHSAQENFFVGHHTENNPTWIGLRKVDQVWTWTDGSPVDFENWNSNFLFGNDYSVIWVDQWANGDCGEERQFICRKKDSICPDVNWLSDERECFLLSEQKRNFSQALSYCQQFEYSTLITWSDQENFDHFLSYILGFGGTTNYWIGYLRNSDNHIWSWVDGTARNFERWFYEYPSDDSDANCAYMFSSAWDDSPFNFWNYVCKHPLQ